MSFPSDRSFYHILMNHEAMRGPGADGDERRLIFSSMSTFAGAQEKTMNRYVRMAANASNTLSNEDIIKIIFDKRYEETRTGIIGNIDEKEFNRKFGAGISNYESFDERLKGIFLHKSFPETYFHPRIATVLCSTNKLTTEPPAQKRIKETGEIVLSAITSETPLAMMLAIASSHKLRNINITNSPDYNAETVEFTLLTFSFFGATACEITNEAWFFYWKVFGSMMGLPPENLHSNSQDAGNRMKKIQRESCPNPPEPQSRALLDTFIKCFLPSPKQVTEACQTGWISSRMEAYLRSKARWPLKLARPNVD